MRLGAAISRHSGGDFAEVPGVRTRNARDRTVPYEAFRAGPQPPRRAKPCETCTGVSSIRLGQWHSYLGLALFRSHRATLSTFPMCSAWSPRRSLPRGLGTTRSIRTVTTGASGPHLYRSTFSRCSGFVTHRASCRRPRSHHGHAAIPRPPPASPIPLANLSEAAHARGPAPTVAPRRLDGPCTAVPSLAAPSPARARLRPPSLT